MTKNDLKNLQALIDICKANKIKTITIADISITFEPTFEFMPEKQAMPSSPSQKAREETKLLLQTATDLSTEEIDRLL